MNSFKIVWTSTAKNTLKEIYDFYKPKSVQVAKNIVTDIRTTVTNIKYPEQYQADEILPQYRRMIVRHYKILYSFKNDTIRIHRIFDTRQNPDKLTEDNL